MSEYGRIRGTWNGRVVEQRTRRPRCSWRPRSPSLVLPLSLCFTTADSDHAAMDDEQRRQDDWAKERKHRLPTFQEVLSRRTRPPVDLFMF